MIDRMSASVRFRVHPACPFNRRCRRARPLGAEQHRQYAVIRDIYRAANELADRPDGREVYQFVGGTLRGGGYGLQVHAGRSQRRRWWHQQEP